MVSLNRLLGVLRNRGIEIAMGANVADERRGVDIFDAANRALENAGPDSITYIRPGRYTKSGDGDPVQTQLVTQHEGQRIDFQGTDVQLADGADVTPVRIEHNGAIIQNAVIDGNQANNNVNTALEIASGVSDVLIRDFEFDDVPVGIDVDGITNCLFSNINNRSPEPDVEVGVRLQNCSNIIMNSSNITGFTQNGMELINSEDLEIENSFITTDPDGQAVADAGILNEGTIQSRVSVAIETDGDIREGIRTKAFDPGGANESIPDDNLYDVKIEGARDVGARLSDSEQETVVGIIAGEYDTGRTTQAFLIDHPDGVEDTPGHSINLDVQKVNRVTDTQIDSTNAGMRIEGHYSKVNDPSTVQFRGTGEFVPSFGPSTPNPTFNILTGTVVETSIAARRDVTDSNGQVTLDWSDRFSFEDKPSVQVQFEHGGGETPVGWYIDSFTTDGSGRFTGATVQLVDSSGAAVGNNAPVIAQLQGT